MAVVTGHRVVKLDIPNRKAHLDNGMAVTYDKCLIATGKFCTFCVVNLTEMIRLETERPVMYPNPEW